MNSGLHPLRALRMLPLLGLLLGGCADPLRTTAARDAVELLPGSGSATTRADPVDVVSVQLEGDEIALHLRFGGGCAEHDFALRHAGAFMGSEPVQTNLTLAHDAHGDMCEALLHREIRFDLSPVKQAYQQAYSRHGVIVLHVRAPGTVTSPADSVRYEF